MSATMRKDAEGSPALGGFREWTEEFVGGTRPRLGCQVRNKTLGWGQPARAQGHAGRVSLRQDRQTDGLQGVKLGTKQWVAVLCLAKLEPLTES
jgi:hypothetical protein